jgi:hypothetical protein
MDLQHAPSASTAAPSPPHTPHASTTPGGAQHLPQPSRSPAQHFPELMSMYPEQQAPTESTTPSVHGGVLGAGGSSGTSHMSPAQRDAHTQVCVATSHCQCPGVPMQSVDERHPHVPVALVSQVVAFNGRAPAVTHSASVTSLPRTACWQVTLRVCVPTRAQACVGGGAQGDHGPTAHTVKLARHGNRLQGRQVSGTLCTHRVFRDTQGQRCFTRRSPSANLTHRHRARPSAINSKQLPPLAPGCVRETPLIQGLRALTNRKVTVMYAGTGENPTERDATGEARTKTKESETRESQHRGGKRGR